MSYKTRPDSTPNLENSIAHPTLTGRRSLSPQGSNPPLIKRTGTMPASLSHRVTSSRDSNMSSSKSGSTAALAGRQHIQNPVTSSSARPVGHSRKGIPPDSRQPQLSQLSQQQLLQPPSRDRYQPGSPPGGSSNTQASQFFTKVKDRFVEKVFQTTSEGPQLAAVVQERRQRAAVEYEAKLLADCVGRWKDCIGKEEDVKRPMSLQRQPQSKMMPTRGGSTEGPVLDQPVGELNRGRGAWARAITKLHEDKLREAGRQETISEEGDSISAMPIQAGSMKGKWGAVISKLNRERRASLNVEKTGVLKTLTQGRPLTESNSESKSSGESLGSGHRATRDRNETIQAARLAFRRRSISEDNCLPLFPPPYTLQQKPPGFTDSSPQGTSQELGGIVCSSDDFQAIIKISQKASVRQRKKNPVSSAECIAKGHNSSTDMNQSGASLDERSGGRSSGGSSLSVTSPHNSLYLTNPASRTPRTSAGQISLTVSEAGEKASSRRSSSDGRSRQTPEGDPGGAYTATALWLTPGGSVTTVVTDNRRSSGGGGSAGRASPAAGSQKSILITTSPSRSPNESGRNVMFGESEEKQITPDRGPVTHKDGHPIDESALNTEVQNDSTGATLNKSLAKRMASEDESITASDGPPDVVFDELGQTWDVYGAEFDPEILGDAIQLHLEKLMRGKGIATSSSRFSLSDGEEESEEDEEKASKASLTERGVRRKETRSLSSRFSDEVPRKKASNVIDQSRSTDNFLVRLFCSFHRRNS